MYTPSKGDPMKITYLHAIGGHGKGRTIQRSQSFTNHNRLFPIMSGKLGAEFHQS